MRLNFISLKINANFIYLSFFIHFNRDIFRFTFEKNIRNKLFKRFNIKFIRFNDILIRI